MADLTYITGKIRTAPEITGISGISTFTGTDSRGGFYYDGKLNMLVGIRVRLLPSDIPEYDYVVEGTGGIQVRSSWTAEIVTEVFWDQVPIDTEIEVSTDNTIWKKMHFAEYIPDSPDSKPYYVWVAGRTSWSALNTTEVTEITMKPASQLSGKYFELYSPTKAYYVWFNVDNANPNPNSSGGPLVGTSKTGVEVKIAGTDAAEAVATKSKVVIDGLADFIAIINPQNSSIVAIAAATAGITFDAGVGSSGLTITVRVQGGDKESYKYARII